MKRSFNINTIFCYDNNIFKISYQNTKILTTSQRIYKIYTVQSLSQLYLTKNFSYINLNKTNLEKMHFKINGFNPRRRTGN